MSFSITTLIWMSILTFTLHKVVKWLLRYKEVADVARKVRGLPHTHWIKGDMVYKDFDEYMEQTLEMVVKTRARLHKIWVMFFYPVYSVDHPETAKVIFKHSVPKTESRGGGYTLLRPWIGNGLIGISGGSKWERNRRLLTPAFHFDILKDYVTEFNNAADILLEKMSDAGNGGKHSVEITHPISAATLDSLLRCALSYIGDVQEQGTSHPYVDAVNTLAYLYIKRQGKPLMFYDCLYHRTEEGRTWLTLCDYVHNFADTIITARKKTLAEQTDTERESKGRLDFLDILLTARDETGEGLKDEEIRAEVDTFMFAGHDTTSSAISWAIYALGKYPDLQEEVYQEVMETIGYTRSPQWGDISKLKKMHLFISETMRMYSVVPLIGQEIQQPLTLDDVTLPAKSQIDINIHAMNHHPDVWPDHMEFRPDRFAGDQRSERDAFSSVPFSAGSRNCIGQVFALNEQKIFLSRILQRFEIELDDNHTVIPSPVMIMKAKKGIKVYLRPRD